MRANAARWMDTLVLGWFLVLPAGAEPQSSSFDDHGAAPVLIMILSPRMVHAFSEWPRMRNAAEQAGFVVQSMRDPRVGDREWRAAALAAGRPQTLDLPAFDASLAPEIPGLLNHSPTSLVRLAGRLHPWPVTGVMPDAAWTAVLKQRLDQLRAAR